MAAGMLLQEMKIEAGSTTAARDDCQDAAAAVVAATGSMPVH